MTSRISTRSRTVGGLLLLALLVVSGCGGDDLNSPTAVQLKGIANLYLDYAVAKNGQGPATEQDLKKHIKGLASFILQSNHIDPKDVDAAFVSGRDQQPFVVLYGVRISGISATSAPLLAHEKTGKNGKRLVVYANTKVESADEARLQELLAAKTK